MSSSLPLAIIQFQTPPEAVIEHVGEQHHWFISALGLQPGDYIVVRPDLGEVLPEPHSVAAAVLSGSWAMVTDHAEWSERSAAWIRSAVEQQLPLLGVCFGHQLMSYALGGWVDDNPRGWERGLKPLQMKASFTGDALLSQLPAHFSAWLSHRQSVLQPPPGAQVLASSAQDDCQIIRYTPHALSVQFHPEFTRSIMSACLQHGQAAVSLMEHQADPAGPLHLLQAFWNRHRQARRLA